MNSKEVKKLPAARACLYATGLSRKELDKLHGEFPKLKSDTNIKIEMPLRL